MVEEQLKTGTTTVGIVCKDGVVLAADKRATAGYQVSYKKFEKVMQLTDNLAVTVAGTVSDVQLMAKYIKAELKLKSFKTGKKNTVKEAANLLSALVYGNIRKFSAIPGVSHFVMGGFDETGQHLYDISPDGSIAEMEDYVSSGSGSVYAYGVLETLYKDDLTVKEGTNVALKAVNAALKRDIASGNGVDVLAITKDGIEKVAAKTVSTGIEV